MAEDEIKKVDVDGSVIVIPAGETAYLIADIKKLYGTEKQIIPFEKVPIEARVEEAIKKLKKIFEKKKKEVV